MLLLPEFVTTAFYDLFLDVQSLLFSCYNVYIRLTDDDSNDFKIDFLEPM